MKLFIFATLLLVFVAANPPSIVYVLLDDVGWADFSYNNPAATIPTVHMDQLSKQGVRLTHHYSHTTCSPSRAALMTGKYASNTGITWPLLTSTTAGLPPEFATLPGKLRELGYQAHGLGKWHLGSATWTSLPVGRGFQSWTGSLLTDGDCYSKKLYSFLRQQPSGPPLPPAVLGVDWIQTYENRSYYHFAEPRHPTYVLTEKAIDIMKDHKKNHRDEPLFLFVSMIAAHSPLQVLPEHEAPCAHIPHLWRRQFCGMMVGVDEAIKNISTQIKNNLGNNSLLIVTSDNGGSTWFGGGNTPLRSGKTTPFEGGVRTPGFIVDNTPQRTYIGDKGTNWDGLMHISDWFPTLYSIAGGDVSTLTGIDGKDVSDALKDRTTSPRTEMLVELYIPNEFPFPDEDMISYRIGDWKLIAGDLRDPHWYFESTIDKMNSTDVTPTRPTYEAQIRNLESAYGQSPFDVTRVLMTHSQAHRVYVNNNRDKTLLFNLALDPTETTNVAALHPDIVQQIRDAAAPYVTGRYPFQPYFMRVSDAMWAGSLKVGDCSMNPLVTPQQCRFVHPFLPDNASPWSVPLFPVL